MRRLWLRNAQVVDPEAPAPEAGSLLVEGGRIARRLGPREAGPAGAEAVDLEGAWLAPGLIDLHHHGSAIFASADAVASRIAHDAASLVRHGVTSFLVTTVAWPGPRLEALVTGAAAALAESAAPGAVPVGLHLEGPWISPEAAGAQPQQGIRPCEPREAAALLDRGEGLIRMVTFAPEVPGAADLQEELARRGIVGALGHTITQIDDAERVIERGARHVTHLYNAMPTFHHRRPGLVGLALADERLTCDLICDGAHVDRRVVAFSARALGERLVLISDRVEPPPDGDFGAGPLRDDGVALRLADGRLAGSRLTLERAVANVRSFAGLALPEAVAACTLRPARLLGLAPERGTLRPGARADLAVLGPDGAVRETWIAGRRVWRARAGSDDRLEPER